MSTTNFGLHRPKMGDTPAITIPALATTMDVIDEYLNYTRGNKSSATAIEDYVETAHLRQVSVSTFSRAVGAHSQVIASQHAHANADRTAILASGAVNAFGYGCHANHSCSVILGSRSVATARSYSVVGGWRAEQVGDPASTNIKWELHSQTGDIRHAGQIFTGHAFSDFAELFPNLTGVKQGYGLLQTLDGYGVRPANEGEQVIGVTSATAGIVLGDTPFSWQGRWLRDEWGAYIMEEVPDPAWEPGEGETEADRPRVMVPKENPEWDPTREQMPRSSRPDEWTVVALIGQVYVRLKEDVEPMDFVKAWRDGIGQTSPEPTNLQVMKITQEYDPQKGYKIGFCLLR